jgi:hypothetical protein
LHALGTPPALFLSQDQTLHQVFARAMHGLLLTELGIHRHHSDANENPKESSDFWLCTNYTSVVKVLNSGD